MKCKTILALTVLALLVGRQALTAQSSEFTYQGRLNDNGAAANGTYDLRFTLYDAVGNPLAGPVTNAPTTVSGGLFTVTLDFGASVFTGADRSLEIAVRTNGSALAYTALSPRQPLTPTPYAIFAPTAGLARTVANGAIQSGQLSTTGAPPVAGQVLSYNGTSLSWQNAATPGGAWAIGGNNAANGNFLGTLNDQALDLKVSGSRALCLQPNIYAPNLIGGSASNFVSGGVEGATIAGGGTLTRFGGVYTNAISADYATIGGGLGNRIAVNGFDSTIAGGRENSLQFGAYRAAIGGGIGNTVTSNAYESTIAGGNGNTAENNGTFVGGGYFNHNKGSSATLAGGYDNTVSGNVAFIGGGARNRANSSFSTIAGGENNTVDAEHSTIAGGRQNQIQTNAYYSSIGGGNFNKIKDDSSVIGGGVQNQIQEGASSSVISGGTANTVASNAFASFIGGGYLNIASGIYAIIPGGYANEASGSYSFAAGSHAKAPQPGAFVWADSQNYDFGGDSLANSVNFRCSGGVRFSSGSFLGINQNVSWSPGSGTWSFSSDRNLKDRLQAVNPQTVLEKVSCLPISEWSYKGYPQRHIGAMAQDFHALFPLNDDDKMLNELDLHGVALAAIQGVNLKLEQALKEKDAKIVKLEGEVAGLKSAQLQASAEWDIRFHTLQKAVARMADKSGTTLAVNHQTREAQ